MNLFKIKVHNKNKWTFFSLFEFRILLGERRESNIVNIHKWFLFYDVPCLEIILYIK